MRELTQRNQTRHLREAGGAPSGTTGFIYLIQPVQGGAVKIGWSKNPEERLAALQTASPWELTIRRTFPAEMTNEIRLHMHFAPLRLRGEWFRPEGEIAELLNGAEPDWSEITSPKHSYGLICNECRTAFEYEGLKPPGICESCERKLAA